MARKKTVFAICYDFDGTLTAGNMQEYDFLPTLKLNKNKFWENVATTAKTAEADTILIYMKLMLDKAREGNIPVRKINFMNFAKKIKFYNGVEKFFDLMNNYAKSKNIVLEHYIISSGLKEMIEGTTISKFFKKIYASSFVYDANDVAVWPAVAVNYTTKTQFIFRINKGVLDVYDDNVNNYIAHDDRRVAFPNMVYIGDGKTDAPCLKLVKEYMGHSVAVYDANSSDAKKLLEDDRVNYICKADYSDNSNLVKYLKSVIDKVATDTTVADIENKITS